MKVTSNQLAASFDYFPELNAPNKDANLVLVHGVPYSLQQPVLLENLSTAFPNACIAGCSSAGEILNGEAYENSIVYCVIEFDNTSVRQTRVTLSENEEDEFEAGKTLAKELIGEDLVAVILFCEGLTVDCDELISGVSEVIGTGVSVIGGLAADMQAYQYSVVMDRDGVYDDAVIAIGVYGKRIEIKTAISTFDQEGVELDITLSDSNIIRQINQKPALAVYEELILQQNGSDLSSIISHPLVILDSESKQPLYCRTINGYDVESGVVTAAGSIPEGPARLISLTLCDDILKDTNSTCVNLNNQPADFAFVINCAGRKDAMGCEWIREVTFIQKYLENTPSFGFYSYGEIGESNLGDSVVVHNHSLTIMTFIES